MPYKAFKQLQKEVGTDTMETERKKDNPNPESKVPKTKVSKDPVFQQAGAKE